MTSKTMPAVVGNKTVLHLKTETIKIMNNHIKGLEVAVEKMIERKYETVQEQEMADLNIRILLKRRDEFKIVIHNTRILAQKGV